jgi:hypothetical protein
VSQNYFLLSPSCSTTANTKNCGNCAKISRFKNNRAAAKNGESSISQKVYYFFFWKGIYLFRSLARFCSEINQPLCGEKLAEDQ